MSLTVCLTVTLLVFASARAADPADRPWLDARRSPDERATLAVAAMTLDEKIGLLHGPMALPFGRAVSLPAESIPAAGYVPGIPRLGIPALSETDASLGVANPNGVRPGDVATALPSSLALAPTFDPPLAYRAGLLLGAEASAKGFNVLLGGAMNLARDPRNGRNFEYLGEDPWLAGVMAGEMVRGTQDQHVISTVKHFALNANELNRQQLDARIDRSAMRDSDLLAFEIAIERGHPGSVMCAYNKVNGEYACGNHWLLTDVLKQDWHYPGWVMSDWGAVHDVNYAAAGLDQESGEQLDKAVFFAAPLRQAVDSDAISKARLDDMVHRILRSMFDVGVVDHPPVKMVIGGHANLGVLSGGGSAQVIPSNGAVVRIPIGGGGVMANFGGELFDPSAPYDAIHALAPDSVLRFDAGDFPARAADAAAKSDVAIVFVTRHELEGSDVPDLTLPDGQDAMIAAVAKANPRTIVVLETGNPVAMPWLSSVAAVLASWYPGQEGGQAIADLLFGAANPSGRLPLTFPRAESDLVRPSLPNFGAAAGAQVHVDYTEGATVGYRGYGERAPPLDPRLLGSFDEERRRWIVRHGVYRVRVAHSAQDLGEGGEATVAGGPWAQGATS